MSKALIVNFDTSEEYLYKWLMNQPNCENIIKRLISDEFNRKSQNRKLTYDELNEISQKAKEIFCSENRMNESILYNETQEDELFDPNYFRIIQDLSGKQNKNKEVSSKDLNDLFDDDSFWD